MKKFDKDELAEVLRIMTISSISRQHSISNRKRDEWIRVGRSIDYVTRKVLSKIVKRSRGSCDEASKATRN